MILTNLFAGPGAGKSTTAAGIFYFSKLLNINCELITEYAKDKVWDQHHAIFDNQLYITAKQYHRQFRLLNQVDVAVTDSPLLLSTHYNKNGLTAKPQIVNHFNNTITGLFEEFDNINFFIRRVKPYNPKGRYQNEEEAKKIDEDIHNILIANNVDYEIIDGDRHAAKKIVRKIIQRIKEKQ